MRRNVLILITLGAFSLFNAQNGNLSDYFKNKRIENQKKYDLILGNKSNARVDLDKLQEKKSKLAGFLDKTPIYWKTDDRRANISSKVTELQSGTVNGNAIPAAIDGNGINIIVMDGGKIFEKHREFGAVSGVVTNQRIFDKENGATSYANHATNVAGIIGAIGVGDYVPPYGTAAVKGVLTKVNFDSYSFSTTPSGTNYEKIQNALNANISNHSYGINLGWDYETATSGSKGEGWYFPFANYSSNPDDTFSGSYYDEDADFDKIVYSNPNHIIIKSAGNSFGGGPLGSNLKKYKYNPNTGSYEEFANGESIPSNNCANGYYCIGWGSLAKNIIVVGATEQLDLTNYEYTNSTDVTIASYSSAGPRKDGAIKPDITAVGSTMAVAGYLNDTTYSTVYVRDGTSYSAPVISGIAGAMTQLNRMITNNSSFTYKADEMKALLTHTANEAGNNPGPDVSFGWGFADATKAAQLVLDKNNNKVIFQRNTLNSGVKYTKEIIAKANEPLKATISWIDPAAVPFSTINDLFNNHQSRIINDLDLRIIDTTNNTVYYPWKLDVSNPLAAASQADNTVDNVEQVLINAPIAGRKYRIEVSNKGNLVNDNGLASAQDYAFIVTGVDSTSLSTNEISAENLISVYPTKTKDIVNILIPKEGKSIDIFDMSGKSVLKTTAKNFQTIDVSKLPKGVYILNIKTEKGLVSKKIIKE